MKTKIKEAISLNQEKINRINELARKSRTSEGLTEEEKAEQAALRQEYRDSVKANLVSQLESIEIVDPQSKN